MEGCYRVDLNYNLTGRVKISMKKKKTKKKVNRVFILGTCTGCAMGVKRHGNPFCTEHEPDCKNKDKKK